MKYLLDTNICIYIIKKNPSKVIEKFRRLKPGSVAISSITVSELYYGVYKSSRQNENMIALQEFLQPLEVLDFCLEDALEYGKIRTQLEEKGKLVGAMDLLIASIAKRNNLILVTNNTKEFTRIPELICENWI
ncbi:MAG: type II toxin-antitoxin system VapC family toxin [Ignavibacteriales bacterium]|nr:MAG: type II toxin-antitoxin system VapC family toxin [Ignavibacteriales bacterium]